MLSARELNSESLPEPHLDQRAAHLHARLRGHAGAGEPGDAGGPAGPLHQGPPAAVRRSTCSRRAEHLLRRAVERPRVREDDGARVPLPAGRRQRLHDRTTGDGGVPISQLLPQAALQRPVPLAQAAARATTSRATAACCSTGSSPERVARIAPFLRYDPRPVPARSRTAGCSGCRTPTRPATAIPYSTPASDGINYIRNSVKADGRRLPRHASRSTWSTTATRSRRRSQRIFPAAQAAGRDARGHAHAPALPARASSRCRRAMYSTYHMTNPAVFYNKEDQWEVPSWIDGAGAAQRDAAVLHDHEAAGRAGAGVHPDAALHAARGRTTWRRGWWRAATASTTAA